jgi:hypothetical protein
MGPPDEHHVGPGQHDLGPPPVHHLGTALGTAEVTTSVGTVT